MKKLALLLLVALPCAATIFHQPSGQEWVQEAPAFTEMIVSWNAKRPQCGSYLVYISVKTGEWSPWVLYARWGSDGQSSFKHVEGSFHLEQDTLDLTEPASAFRVKVVPEGEAPLEAIWGLHVYTNSPTFFHEAFGPSLNCPVPGISQVALPHPRNLSLCSPTSTCSVVSFLSDKQVDPIAFASGVWDSGFDIYGNWVFNVAEAAAQLGASWTGYVTRLTNFSALYQHLQSGTPIVVSVRGPLPGSAAPYAQGHLIVVTGFDAERLEVLCMDPAFPSNEQTIVRYALPDFLTAWGRRGRVSYIFEKYA